MAAAWGDSSSAPPRKRHFLKGWLSMPIPALYLCLLAALALGLAILFYPRIERFMIFYPETEFSALPGDYGLRHDEVTLQTADGVHIHGWFFPGGPADPVILFCHGNAGNISHRLDNIRCLLDRGLQVFIFDYRGYGRSHGTPSEQGLYRDGLAAYGYLTRVKGFAPEQVIVFGRSLGAAVAVEIALRREVGGLILESAFTSLREMARSQWLFYPFSFFLPAHYDNLAKIPGIAAPKLLIHGDRDEIVPFALGRRLFDAAGGPKRFYRIMGAGHNDTYVLGAYFEAFAAFAMAPGADLSAPSPVPRPDPLRPESPSGPFPPTPSR